MRKSLGISQVEISQKLDIAQATYARWETGANWPDTSSIEKLALFYGVRSSRFFYDPDLEKPLEAPPRKLSNKEIKNKLIELIEQLQ